MTIREGFGAVLSWFEKWRPSIWMTDARTDDLQLELQVAREGWKEARKDVEHLRADARHATEEVVRWKQTAIDRVLEIGRLQAEPDKLREQMRIDREAQKRNFLAQEETIRKLASVQPEERRALGAAISSLTADRDAWKALAESRDHEISELTRENVELRREVTPPTTIRKLRLSREGCARLRAKLAAIEERNGPVWDHPEYRKVARKLRVMRDKLKGIEYVNGVRSNGQRSLSWTRPHFERHPQPESTIRIKRWSPDDDGMKDPVVVLFGVQAFGPFENYERARKWADQSDIGSHPKASFVTLTKPEFDEEASGLELIAPSPDNAQSRVDWAKGGVIGGFEFGPVEPLRRSPAHIDTSLGTWVHFAHEDVKADADAKREQERATLDTICGVKSPLPTVQFGEIGATGHGC